MGKIYRTPLPFILLVALFLCSFGTFTVNAQTVGLRAAQQQNSDGNWEVKLLNKPSKTMRFDLSESVAGTGAQLKIGALANTYTNRSIDISGSRLEFNPQNINLPPGRYYARVTNSSSRSFSNIQSDANANEDIFYSNEIQFIIEAQNAPRILTPRGQIQSATPTFEWEPVAGVKAYWIILSSTPFDIVTDENDDISIQGANMVWQFITSETSAQYGDINPNTPYQNEAPPLTPNEEYSFAILNLYEEDNPVYSSPVFGGVIPVTYVNDNPIPKPSLISPAHDSEFNGDETITFRWSDVEEAISYTVYLYEVVTLQGVDASVPIWSATTTNNLIDYPAFGSLKKSVYKWNVVANDESGGGSSSGNSSSPTNNFDYNIPLGEFSVSAQSSNDNSSLVGVEITMRAISGGVTPNVPTFLQSSSTSDSLVTGTYEFTAKKEGYIENTREIVINEGRTTFVPFTLDPLPASISGIVNDDSGDNLENATIELSELQGQESYTTSSNNSGEFTLGVPSGNYSLTIRKNGYIKTEIDNITLGLNEQIEYNDPFVLVNDEAIISGYVFNDGGNPIRLAKVTLNSDNNSASSQEIRTTSEGFYRFTVSSGSWIIRSEKSGFVLNAPLRLSVSAGQNLQSQNITMIGQANQISGFARETIINDDGSVGSAPLEGVEIRAIPSEGSVISTTSQFNGSFSLNLKSGSYTITAIKNNYNNNNDVEITLQFGETLNGINFELSPNPSSMSGRVVSPDGSGLGNVQIIAEASSRVTTTTSSGGYYSMSLPVGNHTVRARLSGYSSSGDQNITLSAGQELGGVNFTLNPNAVVISGSVRSEEGQLAYSTVFADNGNGDVNEISADEFGDYTFSLSPANWSIYSKKTGFSFSDTTVVRLDPGQSSSNNNFTLLPRNRTIAGIITDGSDPVRDAQIRLNNLETGEQIKSTLSKVDGSYALQAETGLNYRVVISKSGYQSVSSTITPLEQTLQNFSLNGEISPSPAQISGAARDVNNIPLQNTTVELRQNNATVYQTNTNSSGQYTAGIEAGNYTLRFTKAGYKTITQNITLALGENRENVNVSMEKNFALYSGTITDQGGTPVSGVQVRLNNEQSGSNATSGNDGSYILSNIVAGTYTLEISRTGYETVRKTNLAIPSGGNITDNITINRFDASIKGISRTGDGTLLNNTSVKAVRNDGTEFTTVSADDGSYEFNALPAGTFKIYGQRTGYLTADTAAAVIQNPFDEITDADVILSAKNGSITGTITDQQTGGTISSASVLATGRGSDQSLSNSSGAFTIEALSTGDYEVIASIDQYEADTASVTLSDLSLNANVTFALRKNIGSISGQVLNQNGSSLGEAITVRATDLITLENHEVISSQDGSFVFEKIPNNRKYILKTRAQGQQFVNSERQITFPSFTTAFSLSSPLEVTQNSGIIRGNAQIFDANIELINAADNSVLRLNTSGVDGAFRFVNLPAGNYKVTARKEGYIATPDTQSVSVAFNQEVTGQNFSMQENQGDVSVTVTNATGQPLEGVQVTIISTEGSSSQNKKLINTTGSDGVLLFEDLDASNEYQLFAQRSGYSLQTNLDEAFSLTVGGTITKSISMQRNEFNLTGKIYRSDTKSALQGVSVQLTADDGTLQKAAETNSNGVFNITELPNKAFTLTGQLSGYTEDTLSFTISDLPQEVKTYQDEQVRFWIADTLLMNPAFIQLLGDVKYSGQGVSGAEVLVQGSVEATARTNSSGRYRITNYPVSFATQDTISLSIRVSYEGFEETKIKRIVASQLGKTVRVADYVIPSGQIQAAVKSGELPLAGLPVIIADPNATKPREFVTDKDGRILTNKTLRAGTYTASVSTNAYVLPTTPFSITLAEDTSTVVTDLLLPYRFSPPDSIQAAYPTNVMVTSAGTDVPNGSAVFYYKSESQSNFRELSLTPVSGGFSGSWPAVNTLENVQFYVQINDSTNGLRYLSEQTTEKPGAKDLLSDILLRPALSELTLRTGDEYNARISIRDGSNNIMSSAFDPENGSGSITLTGNSDALTAIYDNGEIDISTPNEPGRYDFTLQANFGDQQMTETFSVTVEEVEIDQINVQSFGNNTVSNLNPFTFNYTANDTSGKRIHLGSSLTWSVEPEYIGDINNSGTLTPTPNTLGEFNVLVEDGISGVTAKSETFNMLAELRSVHPEVTLSYGDNFVLNVEPNSVSARTRIRLSKRTPEEIKKYTNVLTENGISNSYTSSSDLYTVTASGGSFIQPVELGISNDESLRLFEGERHVAYFNQQTLQWELLEPGTLSSGNAVSGTTENLGQFVILAENEPLDLKHFAILPNPFSPDVAPAKIGYFLTSENPPAYVTMHIYNMRGEHIKTLLDRDPQLPGRYGSRTGLKQIEWDGTTNTGDKARNGRYIIQITIEDGQKKKEFLKTIVLIK